jgi:cysteine desulfurase
MVASRMVYLDYCSTTPVDPVVSAVFADYLTRGYANPASQHRAGQEARRELERLRRELVRLAGGLADGMRPDRLAVTSGGTEANHLAVLGLVSAERPRVLLSGLEHPGVRGAADIAACRGCEVTLVGVDPRGVIRLEELAAALASGPPAVVCLMLVNNETGVIQPVAEAARLAHQHGALLHCDAVQAPGHVGLSFHELAVDTLAIAAHKFHGPRGVGGLLIRSGLSLTPQMRGGEQQQGLRPGTEDVALVAAMHAAFDRAVCDLETCVGQIAGLRDAFELQLHREVDGPMVIHGSHAGRSCHVANISFPGVDRQALMLAADSEGLAISTGSACASGSSEPSPVLQAMGLPTELIDSAVRVSFGKPTTVDEVRFAAATLSRIVNRMRS